MYTRKDIEPLRDRAHLSIATVHGDEMQYIQKAFDQNWVTTAGENINEVERIVSEKIGVNNAVGLSAGTASLHLCIKLAAEKVYGHTVAGRGCLEGKRVFASDMTFAATVFPATYEGANLTLIDSERDTWNMDPRALKKAFELYPDTKIVIVANLYGTPAKLDEIKAICDANGAVMIEDAAESLGASYKGKQTGSFGTYNAISFNGNKIITGSCGGMLLADDTTAAHHARKWSTQARENAFWYQHEEVGFNYRMSNITAGIVRAQLAHLEEHIAQKKAVYMRYKEGFKDLPVTMNPYMEDIMEPNFWLSCLLINEDAMCKQVRGEQDVCYVPEHGKSCPTEILEVIASINAEGRPIWKPMSMQPIFRMNDFVTAEGYGRGLSNAYINEKKVDVVGKDIFQRGLCLPSMNMMTVEQQERVIAVVKRCFE